MLSSSAAIGSILLTEKYFSNPLHSVDVIPKLLTTKIMVSLVFTQGLGLQVAAKVLGYPDGRTHLALASILCWESVFVGYFHCCLWHHNETWYRESTPTAPTGP